MNVAEAFRAGSREIGANKFRSVLSFAAISVGVASLLYTFAQTRGMEEALRKNLELMGPGRMTIEMNRSYTSKGLSEGLTLEDAEAIRKEFPRLYMVYPDTFLWNSRFVHDRFSTTDIRVLGTTAEWRKRDWVYSLRGRFLNDWDEEHQAQVCVVVVPGGWVHKPWWASYWHNELAFDGYAAHHDLLGRQIRLEDSYFTVVGVLQAPPQDLDPRWESWRTPRVIVPMTSFLQRLQPRWLKPKRVVQIVIDTGDEAHLAAQRRNIEQLLLRRHREERDFEITDMREAIESAIERQRKFVAAATALGLVALLAGGIGIMNVTLAAIFSRVKEIGVRRALGATSGDIMAQFIVEAGLLGAAGGAAGLGLGLIGINYLKSMTEKDLAQITWLHCLAALALGALVSALFSAGPAWQASRLNPIEALKAE